MLRQTYYCLFLILKTKQTCYYNKLDRYPIFYDTVMQGLEDRSLRINCLNIVDHLSSTSFTKIINQLYQRDIISVLHRIACSPEMDKSIGVICIILNIYHNLIISEASALRFIAHPAMESVTHAIANHEKAEVRDSSFDVLRVLFSYLPDEQATWLFK